MAAITEKQRIAKRAVSKRPGRTNKKPSLKPTNKSAETGTGFMSHFSQKPVRKSAKSRQNSIFSAFINRPKKAKKVNVTKSASSGKKRSGFTFPVPSIPTLAAAAGTVIIALAAFNWEDIYISMPETYAYQPGADSESGQQTMLYAATGIPGILTVPGTISGTTDPQTEVIDGPNDLISFEWQEYRVKRGDSVSVIAQKFDVSVGAIIASNEIRNARTLQEGKLLRIPNIDGIPYQIKSGDSLSKIAATFNVPLEMILDVNDIRSDNIRAGETIFIPGARMNDIDLRMSLGELFMYPVPSRHITSPYGMRIDPIGGHWAFHTGIDLRANTGTPVVASLDGQVSVVSENRIYGKYIIITHDNGFKTLYAHLNSYSARQGDRVARGRKIAESGNTGYSTGPHLHFSIYDKNNKLVNPLELLR